MKMKFGNINYIPIEISDRYNSDYEIIDLLIYKNHYVLIKKLHIFLGKSDNSQYIM